MSSENPQPGDHTPRDGKRAGDQARLDHAEPSLRGGSHPPSDGAHASDYTDPGPLDNAARGNGPKRPNRPPADGGVHFSAPFIKRPVATSLLSVAIILAGAAAYKLLPVASLPEVEYPVISVGASLPGADPETMASAVATPLERQFSKIAGINQMTSSSSTGSAGVTMQFDLNRDVNGAARDVQAAINAARSQLPANLPSNPTYRKINPSDSPILMLTLTSDTVPVPQMYDAADSILAQKIAQVLGVGQVNIGGSAKPAVRIEANPTQLASYGIGLDALRSVIGQVNVNQPVGYINGEGQRWSIDTTDQLFGAQAYAPLIVATDRGPVTRTSASSGLPASIASAVGSQTVTVSKANSAAATGRAHGVVRIEDVAEVTDSVEDIHTGGLFNGKPSILIMVFKSPGANVISAVDNVLKILPTLQASIPPAIQLHVAMDRTATIRASVKDARNNLLLSIVLVILVVFLFLREVRSTLIPSVSVPLSLLGTFGIMYLLGYTLDNLSVMALTISTGFVIDDAIVVIENISRRLEEGMAPFKAAMVGSREIGFTVLSMSTSLIAVFIPILLMGGIVGRLFREFAVTLSAAILVSLVVSLTTTPMLSARFLKAHDPREQGWFYRTGGRLLDLLTAEYERGLRWVLKHRAITLTVFLFTIALNMYLFVIIPKGFFPQQDTGRIGGMILGQQDTSFLVIKQDMQTLSAVVQKDPGVQNVMTFLGGGRGSSNSANMFMSLKPSEERAKTGDTADVILNRLRPKTAGMPGVRLYLQAAQELNIGGRPTATQYQYSLTADSVDDLNTWSPRLMEKMETLPELKDVATDQMSKGLEARLVIDRDTASRLGVSPLAIDQTLSDAFGQAPVSTTYMPLNQYHVVLEVAQQYQQSPDSLRDIYVRSSSGAEIPLAAITHFESRRIPLSVNHQGLSPAATLSFNLSPGVSLSQATAAIERARVDIGMPSSVHGGFQGSAQAFQASLSSEPILIALALTAVYIVLGVLYESYVHPLTILSTLPSAGVGALVALMICNIDLNVIAMIGIILLIGIVKKNAIMMIDFALIEERDFGRTPEDAIYRACLMRFRPIMMTTCAALLGGLPLALGTGTGSELRRPLGIAIVGGLIVSQALTLFTTPVVYLFFDQVRARFARMRGAPGRIQAIPQPVAGD
ncbi:MAG: efflux RND transporter permease subunit [Acidobacteriota bacterium]|nr:efflux RND transporter permease subunit [Acidobacteriota bacterium]